jgi:osmotically-inducible protein OsmY
MQAATPLANQVISAVVHNPHVNLNTMHIETSGDNVTINGTAQTFFEKQMAQEAIRKIDGVKVIDNHLEVVWN